MIENLLKENKHQLSSVVPFDAEKDNLLLLDFTDSNTELQDDMLKDTTQFSKYIKQQLDDVGARYGIGGYAEHRTIYSRSPVFDAEGTEPRRLHLGIDIWGKANTAVIAPLDGLIHSFAFNDDFGDYGATIVLSHLLEGENFYTLYGHLSLASITNLVEGQKVAAGDIIGEFGIQQENGNWPPHLHFQIIKDMEGYKGNYPGVCKYSEKERYLSNCPNPDIILGMMQYAKPKNE